jgi:hypothetical protein
MLPFFLFFSCCPLVKNWVGCKPPIAAAADFDREEKKKIPNWWTL